MLLIMALAKGPTVKYAEFFISDRVQGLLHLAVGPSARGIIKGIDC